MLSNTSMPTSMFAHFHADVLLPFSGRRHRAFLKSWDCPDGSPTECAHSNSNILPSVILLHECLDFLDLTETRFSGPCSLIRARCESEKETLGAQLAAVQHDKESLEAALQRMQKDVKLSESLAAEMKQMETLKTQLTTAQHVKESLEAEMQQMQKEARPMATGNTIEPRELLGICRESNETQGLTVRYKHAWASVYRT